MLIETKHANLSTLAVTIQALHVSGKQMTLAVFRQLPMQQDTEQSMPWGVVRYSIKEEGNVWLVYSQVGILFRRALDPHVDRYKTIHAIKILQGDIKKEEGVLPQCKWNEASYAKTFTEIARLKQMLSEAFIDAERERARASTDEQLLMNLPQLFIAV